MTLPSIAPFLPLCNVQASAVIEATSSNATTGVQCAAVDPATGNVYIGGTFQKVNGVTRQGLACINRSGVLQSWNPGVSGSTYAASGVYAMVWVPGTGLYISGSFTGVGGGTGTTAQTGVALLNSAGAVLTWYPTAGFNYGSILCVDGSGNVYTGGGYGLSQISSSGVVSAWNTGITGPSGIQSACLLGGWLYLGGQITQGNLTAVTTQAFTGVCRVNLATGYFDTWAPSIAYSASPGNENVVSLAADTSGNLYLAGNFTSVLGSTQKGFASIAPAGPTLNSWAPAPTHTGYGWRVAANGTDIYWTSQYATATGGSVKEAGCMSAAGTDLAWDPWVAGPQGGSTTSLPPINGFVFDPSNPVVPAVYAFGYFGNVLYGGALGPITRYQLAKFADRTFSPTHLAY